VCGGRDSECSDGGGIDMILALIEGSPEPTCQKILEGQEVDLKEVDNFGEAKVDQQIAEIPCAVHQEFQVVRARITVGVMN
jgi:hypothetical protein